MEYVIIGAIVGGFIGAIMYWKKKDDQRLEKYLSELSEEQKERLKNTEIEAGSKNNTWSQEAIICDFTPKGETKVAVVALWHNKVIKNDTYDKIQHADINVRKADWDSHGLKKGDFVKIYIDPETEATILFENN